MTRTPCITITTGRFMSWSEWVAAVDYLETRAVAAEQHGLPRTAKSWRDMIKNLSTRAIDKKETPND
jgi:hypothetical protein